MTPANAAFQVTVVADFGQFARSPASPVWIAAPPGGVTLGSGATVWAAYHKNFTTFDPGGGEVPVDWAMLTAGGSDYRLIRGRVTADVTAKAATFTIDTVTALAGGLDPTMGNPATTVTITKSQQEILREDEYVTAVYFPGAFSSPPSDWELILVERERSIRGSYYATVDAANGIVAIDNIAVLDSGLDPRLDPTDAAEQVFVKVWGNAKYETGDKIRADYNAGVATYSGNPVDWEVSSKPQRRVRGTVVESNVGPATTSFTLNTLVGIYGQAPSGSITVQNVFGLGYVGGLLAEAQYNESLGQWENVSRPLGLGCHLNYLTLDGSIYVDAATLAGTGLTTELFGGCLRLAATGITPTAGCGIDLAANVISVSNSDLAGEGLIAGTGCALDVNVGCGLEIVSDEVRVNPADFAGKGLHEVAGSTCDELELDLGCGLQFDAQDKVAVKNSDLAGSGLGTEGTCAPQSQRRLWFGDRCRCRASEAQAERRTHL